jgi:hypothetical protein
MKVVGSRTKEDLYDATMNGRLFYILRICGRAIIAARVRYRDKKLRVHKAELTTFRRAPNAVLEAKVGGFIFEEAEGGLALWLPQIETGVEV